MAKAVMQKSAQVRFLSRTQPCKGCNFATEVGRLQYHPRVSGMVCVICFPQMVAAAHRVVPKGGVRPGIRSHRKFESRAAQARHVRDNRASRHAAEPVKGKK